MIGSQRTLFGTVTIETHLLRYFFNLCRPFKTESLSFTVPTRTHIDPLEGFQQQTLSALKEDLQYQSLYKMLY